MRGLPAPAALVRAVAAAAITILVGSCGGGGGGSSAPFVAPVIPVGELRTDLHFGYWWGCRNFLLEQTDHVDTWFTAGICASEPSAPWHLRIAEELAAARAAGNVKHVILKPDTTEPAELRFQLQRLNEGGWLQGWESVTFYPFDEPDSSTGGGLSDEEVVRRVTAIRQVFLDVGLIARMQIGVFYQCATGAHPGISVFDRVGCFRYGGDGCPRLEGDYQAMRLKLKPGAKLWLIPAGSNINNGKEGQQDPACWSSYAQRHPDVWGLVGFMWHSGADPKVAIVGIREIPLMRRLYCEVGRVILNPKIEPRC